MDADYTDSGMKMTLTACLCCNLMHDAMAFVSVALVIWSGPVWAPVYSRITIIKSCYFMKRNLSVCWMINNRTEKRNSIFFCVSWYSSFFCLCSMPEVSEFDPIFDWLHSLCSPLMLWSFQWYFEIFVYRALWFISVLSVWGNLLNTF